MPLHGFFPPVVYTATSWSFPDVRPPSLSPPPRSSSTAQVFSLERGSIIARLRPEVPPPLDRPITSLSNTDSAGDPPVYTTSSPPKYAALPLTTETTLLLAPAPRYSRHHDLEANRERHHPGADRVVLILVVLNALVWAVVVCGYVLEWNHRGFPNHGSVDPAASFAADLGESDHCMRQLCTGQGCFREDCDKFYEMLMSIW